MCRSEHQPYSVLQHSSHQIFKPETTMPLFLCRDSKQGLVGETATVQQFSSSAGMAAAEMARQKLSSSLQSVNIVWTLSDLSGARTSWNSWRGGGGMLLKASSCPTTSFFYTPPSPRPLSWPWKSAAVQIDGLFSWSLTGQKGEEKAPNLGRGARLPLVI